jgi:superfamily II DNA or RNA helicase
MTRNERQALGVQKWISSGFRGTWAWATGTGKTFAAIKAIKLFLTKNKNKNIVVIVPTENLKVQWMQELAKYGIFHDVKVEIINSAVKLIDKVDFIILDECHRYAATLFYEIFKAKNPSIVLGLSATFNRLDGKHELLSKYCPVCDTISVKEAIENKWLSPYKEYKVILEVDDIENYNIANKQFYEAFSFFNFNFEESMRCLTDIVHRRIYAKTMGVSQTEMNAIVFSWSHSLRARKSFVMDHPKKLEITRKILAARPDSKAITFSATIKQAEKIGNGYVVHSGKTKKKNRITVNEFSRLQTGVIHTAKSLDEGADIAGLNLAIILCNTSSQTQKTQRVG